MSTDFLDLIELVRSGDEEATEHLIEKYGGTIRRAIRLTLLDSRLRRVVAESDVFQSVIAKFLFDLWAGRYDFERPEHLAALLKKMAIARVTDAARHHTAKKRDMRRNDVLGTEESLVENRNSATPSQIVANRELLQKALSLMTLSERQILQQRQDKVSWAQIAADLNKSPEAVRKQYERAIERVAGELSVGDL